MTDFNTSPEQLDAIEARLDRLEARLRELDANAAPFSVSGVIGDLPYCPAIPLSPNGEAPFDRRIDEQEGPAAL